MHPRAGRHARRGRAARHAGGGRGAPRRRRAACSCSTATPGAWLPPGFEVIPQRGGGPRRAPRRGVRRPRAARRSSSGWTRRRSPPALLRARARRARRRRRRPRPRRRRRLLGDRPARAATPRALVGVPMSVATHVRRAARAARPSSATCRVDALRDVDTSTTTMRRAAPTPCAHRRAPGARTCAPRVRRSTSWCRVSIGRALDLDRWAGRRDARVERGRSLDRAASGPVLDVGCGPARHVRALAAPRRPGPRRRPVARGRRAWPAPAARQAVWRRRSSTTLPARTGARRCCSTATSASAATPSRLLRRVRELLRPGGLRARRDRAARARADDVLEVARARDGALLLVGARRRRRALPALARAAGFATVDALVDARTAGSRMLR